MNRYEKYKDSGVAWIGEIPQGWELCKTKYLFYTVSGATPKTDNLDFWDGDIVWITPADYKTEDVFISEGRRNITKYGVESCGTTISPAGSIVFSKRAPIGLVAISRVPLCTNQGCITNIPKDNSNSKYYYYVMSIINDQYELLGSGTTFKEISANSFSNFHLPTPPIAEQEAIAEFLDSRCGEIDELVRLQEVMMGELKAYKQSVITETVTRGLNPDAPLRDSGIPWIGSIPAHWDYVKAKYFSSIRSGDSVDSKAITSEGKYEIYGGNGFIGYYDKYNSQNESLIIGRVGALCGNVRYITNCKFISDNALILKCKTNAIYPFCNYALLSANLNQLNISNAQPLITGSKVMNHHFALPPLPEQQQIADHLDRKCEEIDALIEIKREKIEQLKEYKKSVIFEYVTGKKRVTN